MYNLHRPHQGIDDLTPYDKLRSLGYTTPEAICLLPPLILDSVCCLKPLQVKVKSVQDHLDHYLCFSSRDLRLCHYRLSSLPLKVTVETTYGLVLFPFGKEL